MTDDKIGFSQFAAAAAVSAFSPISRMLPKTALETAGRVCWIVPLLCFMPLIGLCYALRFLLTGEERGLCGALESVLGERAGRVVAIVLGGWVIFYGGFLIRSGAERYISTVYKDEELWVFVLTVGSVALAGALGSVRALARMGQLGASVVGVTVVVLLALALPDMERHYLLPLSVSDAGGIAAALPYVFNAATGWVFSLFLAGYIRRSSYRRGAITRWCAYIIMLMLIVVVATVGVLGPNVAGSQRYPFFALISNLKVFNILERIEPVTVMIWVLTDFVFIALLMMSAGEVGSKMLGLKKRRPAVIVSAAAMMATAFLVSRDAFSFGFVSFTFVPTVNLVIAAVFLPILAIIKKLKKVKKRC